MKFKLSFFVIISLFSASCLSQDLNKSNEVKNILSIAAGSTSTKLGFTYVRISRLLSNKNLLARTIFINDED